MSLYQFGCAVAGWADAHGSGDDMPEPPSEAEFERMIELTEGM